MSSTPRGDDSDHDRTADHAADHDHDHPDDHDHETPAPVTDRVHDNSWSANLEKPAHAADRGLVVEQARSAIDHTAPGNHVNLVTHADHGHPEAYLYDALERSRGDAVDLEYVEQCGCGGHVVRAHVD